MMMDIARNIEWSPETYTVKDLLESCKMPVVAMVKQGHCALRDEDSLSQGQVIRIARINAQKCVLARDAKDRAISIPLECPFHFEVLKNKSGSIRGTFRKLKRMLLTDLVRNYQLPHKVRLPSSLHNDPTVQNLIGIDMVSGTIELERLDEEIYLQGNAVNFGELDTTVISIPDHSDLEVSIALGVKDGRQAQLRKLENKLADRVAKEVRFGNASDGLAIRRLVQIGAEVEPSRSRASSSVRSASLGGAPAEVHMNGGSTGSGTGSMYQKRASTNKRPSLSAIEKRMRENNPTPPWQQVPWQQQSQQAQVITNGGSVTHFDNAAFNDNEGSESDELEDEEEDIKDDDLPEPGVWTEVKLEEDDDRDIAPPKDLFTSVSAFSFHNPSSWGFANTNTTSNTKA